MPMEPEELSIESVIFDVDGTLIDSVDLHAKAWVDALRDYGHAVAFEVVRKQIGKGGDQLMPVFLSPHELEEHGKDLEAHRSRILKERYMPLMTAFPGVRGLFRRLIADRRIIALASSAKEDELAHYKKLANIADLIDAETSSDDAGRSKPHPDIFQAALARLPDPDPARAVVVGDTPWDAEAASKAGLRMIGLLCGGWSEDDLRRHGCFAVYRDPADLLAQYDRSPFGLPVPGRPAEAGARPK
jgi:HAD superfamily hydrolase (TIGR01509 family)